MSTANPEPSRATAVSLRARSAGSASRGNNSGQVRSLATSLLASLATLGIVSTCAADYAGGTASSSPPAKRAEVLQLSHPPGRAPKLHLADIGENWPRSLFQGLFGIPQRSEPRHSPRPMVERRLPRREPEREVRRRQNTTQSPARRTEHQKNGRANDNGTYRTMCVRLCDGYYWPINFATHKDNFARDSQVCTKSCSSPAALYYYPNPGGEIEDMVSLHGVPYQKLGTALLYRATYDEGCKCRPHPWETESIERHQKYTHQKQLRAAGQNPGRTR